MASVQTLRFQAHASHAMQSAAARSGNPASTSEPFTPAFRTFSSAHSLSRNASKLYIHSLMSSPVSRRHAGARAAVEEEKTAGTTPEGLPKPPQNPDGYGLGGPGTWFGFGRRQEREVGRLAMMGFAAALVMEVITGKGVLGQLGLDTVAIKGPLLSGLLFLTVAGLVGGWTVIQNPPDVNKAPINEGAGAPRDPAKTFDANTEDPYWTYSRGGIVDRKDGQKGREPFVSDLDDK
eukprot:TRINITY_DN18390_c0_g1_i1.p1 TRINITY_DN18390_c0_g1~~TRINITY_DN18390_c0_g1_i1.p1  ORF type:complete len:235 (-),score=32.04 TRINITY_DN18390_c0_g1_i1:231-935(-)